MSYFSHVIVATRKRHEHYPCHIEYRTRSRTNSGEKAAGDSKLRRQDMDRKLTEKLKKLTNFVSANTDWAVSFNLNRPK